jgi:hypothetical protein
MAKKVNSKDEPSDPLKTVAEALEKAAQTVSDTAADAKSTMERALPGATSFLSKWVYNTCYGVSYGVVFPTVLIAKSIPVDNAFVNGLMDGAKAAMDAVDEMKAKSIESPKSEPPPALPS